jgi:mRNA-degrading endonuclease toxin of MazEF toxin-antitoxin module
MADQLSTVSKRRLREGLGQLSEQYMAAIERAICVQLDL